MISRCFLLAIFFFCGSCSISVAQQPASSAGADEQTNGVAVQENDAQPANDEPNATDDDPPEDQRYTRSRESDGQLLFESRVASFKSEDVTVHLVASLHAAKKSYFEKLYQRLSQSEVVLFEFIGDSEKLKQRDAETINAMKATGGLLDRFAKTMDLSLQLDHIDYANERFVHADLSSRKYSDAIKEYRSKTKEKAGLGLSVKDMATITRILSQVSPKTQALLAETDQAVLDALDERTRATFLVEVTRFLASQDLIKKARPNRPVTILARNAHCFEVLKGQIDAGKKDIAILYGSGHLADMEQELLKMGYQRVDQQWIKAWEVTIPTDNAQAGADAGNG